MIPAHASTGRLVFIDLDGTLFDRTQRLLPSARSACEDLRRAGHTMIICTGRSLPEIYPWIWDLGFSGVIAGAGGFVQIGSQILKDQRIPHEDIVAITKLWQSFDAMWIWQGPDAMYPSDGYLDAFLPAAGIDPDDWRDYATSIAPYQHSGIPHSSAKCTAYLPLDAPDIPEITTLLPPGYTVHGGSVGAGATKAVEVLPHDVSKGDGIRIVVDFLGASLLDTVAIGDSENDIEALKTAAVSIAMGGARPEVARAATHIAPMLSEDGFAQGLRTAGLFDALPRR
ncbi:HAD family phosphatase [Schaalia sp. ZJ405]|uniref:HAD hydrolase family protein n=1 Tax=Schaalia sp. ZJ405 TaxID=2709403 RepID=UPI0013EA731A|nr:HAD family hydrolase [Schaalia sp. ZJ405]QPK80570.1 HAD family phosphatase [Schaalia sp. ZJ405]